MQSKLPSTIERLKGLVDEAEQIVATGMAVATGMTRHDLCQACAVARGYLELARQYDEPINTEDVERVLTRMRAMLDATSSAAQNEGDSYQFE